MPYHQQIKKSYKGRFPRQKNIIYVFFLVIILITMLISPEMAKTPFKFLTFSIVSLKESSSNNLLNFFDSFTAKIKLAEENRKLNERYENLNKNYSLLLGNLTTSKEELEIALGRRVEKRESIKTAFVLAKPPIISYDTILVDLGEKDNIKKGDLVLVGNYLLGIVSETMNKKSLIELYGSKKEKNVDLIVGNKRLNIKGKGAGLGAYEISNTSTVSFSDGDNVRISDYPEYIFGKVVSQEQSPDEQSKNIIIKSPVNIFEISTVEIVSDEK